MEEGRAEEEKVSQREAVWAEVTGAEAAGAGSGEAAAVARESAWPVEKGLGVWAEAAAGAAAEAAAALAVAALAMAGSEAELAWAEGAQAARAAEAEVRAALARMTPPPSAAPILRPLGGSGCLGRRAAQQLCTVLDYY